MDATGFGTVTMDIGRHLIDIGMDVRFLSQNDIGDLPEPFASRTLSVPSFHTAEKHVDASGRLVVGGVSGLESAIPDILMGQAPGMSLASGEPWGDWKPDAAFILGDFAAVRFFVRPFIRAFATLPTFHYCPVEGVDLPPSWSLLWNVVRPVAMSEFGRGEISRVVGRDVPMVYHGVDTSIFRPLSPSSPLVIEDASGVTHRLGSKAACRRFFGQDPSTKWVLRTDRHMPRKNYNSLIRAMGPVLLARPDVRLVIHAREWDQGGNLLDTLSKHPQEVRDRVVLTGLGPVPREVLVALYNAADVYVSSGAEGFGLTIAEAVACGIPAVGIDYSAVPEVVGPAGAVVPVAALTDNEYDHFWARPDERRLGEAVGWMLDHPAKARALGSLGPGHVRANFQWRSAAEAFAALAAEAVSSWGGVPA